MVLAARRPRTVLWLAAHFTHLLRIGVVVQFTIASSFLIGCSDGPAQILLNSVAALFILDCDDLLAAAFDAPWVGHGHLQEMGKTPKEIALP